MESDDEGHEQKLQQSDDVGNDGFIHASHFDMNEVQAEEVKEAAEESDNDEPEIEDINDEKITADNHTNCNITENDKLTALKEVFDEETCTNLLVGFYDACSKFWKKNNSSALIKNLFFLLVSKLTMMNPIQFL